MTTCTCPSGDGSLRWPCPVHPPEPRPRWPAELRIPLRELVAGKAEVRRIEEAMKQPPCVECGAKTAEEAATRCNCAGDKDDCHGCSLWPDA